MSAHAEPKLLLVVEDEPDHVALIRRGFRKLDSWELCVADNLTDALSVLKQKRPQLVLADLNLPDGQATDLCGTAPVIIMTSHGDEDRAVFAMKSGAVDYVVKSEERLRQMPEVVERAYREQRLISEARTAEFSLAQKTGELERNNRRLAAVLGSASQLAAIDDADEALRFMAHVVRRELGGNVEVQEVQANEPLESTSTPIAIAPNRIEMRVANTTAGHQNQLVLTRAAAYDESERALVHMAVSLVSETVRVLETRRLLRDSQAQLLQSEKLKSLGQLAGGIAHDFNNMLTGIMGAAELVELDIDPTDEGIQENVQAILDISEQAADLVSKLLAFSRRGVDRRRPLQARESLRAAQKLLRLSLPRNVELSLEIQDDAIIACDPTLFQNALLNMGINARDAMPEGGLLKISARLVELDQQFCERNIDQGRPGEYLEISVEDNGFGMDSETKNKVFDPFFTTKAPGKGTGLGLSVVFGSFQDAGGCVLVESTPNTGTTFRCYLPEVSAEGVLDTVPQESVVPPSSGKRILIVDDNSQILRSIVQLVARLGHDVHETIHPDEAYDKASKERFDAIVVDVVMPTMSGTELVRQLRMDGIKTPIVFMSGYQEDRTELQTLLEEDNTRFVEKPFRLRDLEAALNEGIRNRAGR